MVKKYIEEKTEWVDKIPIVNGKSLNNISEESPITTHIELLSSRINWLRTKFFTKVSDVDTSMTKLPYPLVKPNVIQCTKFKNTAIVLSGYYLDKSNNPTPLQYVLLYNSNIDSIIQTNIVSYPYILSTTIDIGDDIYCFGGLDISNNMYTNNAKVLNKNTRTWKDISNIPIPIVNHITEKMNTKTILLGGGKTTNNITGNMYAYNILEDTYKPIKSYPFSITNAASTTYDGNVVISGGWNGSSALHYVFMYKPESNKWENFIDLPVSIYGHKMVNIKNILFIIGGYINNQPSDNIYYLDTELQPLRWRKVKTKLPCKLISHGACVVDDRIIVLGGKNKNISNNIYIIQF